jgi:hypothetical protein
MHIPVIAGMYCSREQSVTETGQMQALKEALAARYQRKGLNPVTEIWS